MENVIHQVVENARDEVGINADVVGTQQFRVDPDQALARAGCCGEVVVSVDGGGVVAEQSSHGVEQSGAAHESFGFHRKLLEKGDDPSHLA